MLNHTPRARVALAALAATAVLAAGCSSSGSSSTPDSSAPRTTAAAQFPVTVAAAGGTVTIAHKPTAIVSMSPTATEMLFAIGAGRQVKAVDRNSDFPISAPHTNLDSYQLNAEAVANYKPDLVVVSGLPAKQAAQLRALHITVLDEPAATDLQGTYTQLRQLGQATGHEDGAAAEVAKMKREIAAVVESVPKSASGKYYYELDQTYYSVTSTTFIGRALKLLGLSSIADAAKGAAASGGYPQLSNEFVLKADPAYVFLADTKCCKQTPASVGKRPGWSALGAVTDGRIVALDDDIASRWGPRIVDLLRVVSEAIRQHPAP